MMRGDGVANRLVLAARLQELRAKKRMGALLLAGDCLADVVEETYATPLRRIQPQFRGHCAGKQSHLDRMPQNILGKRSAVLERPHQGEDIA
jgi:hypothetical protein